MLLAVARNIHYAWLLQGRRTCKNNCASCCQQFILTLTLMQLDHDPIHSRQTSCKLKESDNMWCERKIQIRSRNAGIPAAISMAKPYPLATTARWSLQHPRLSGLPRNVDPCIYTAKQSHIAQLTRMRGSILCIVQTLKATIPLCKSALKSLPQRDDPQQDWFFMRFCCSLGVQLHHMNTYACRIYCLLHERQV